MDLRQHWQNFKKETFLLVVDLPECSTIFRMFADMNAGFEQISFEHSNNVRTSIAKFLTKFDAIFTLNQDLLMERHYLNDNVSLMSDGKWSGWSIPGMIPPTPASVEPLANPNLGKWTPAPQSDFTVHRNAQPYFKLHGSSNWYTSVVANLMVIGRNKRSTINGYEILRFNYENFHNYLHKQNTKLMIVGYSFGDDHINQTLRNSVNNSNLQLFVIDPLGIDVMDKNRGATIYSPDAVAVELWPRIIGASRRPLSTTFNDDIVEHGKVMRFFDS